MALTASELEERLATQSVRALDAFADHLVDFVYGDASHGTQAHYYLVVLLEEHTRKNEFVRPNPHLLDLGDVGDDLLNDVVVVRPDFVQFFRLRAGSGRALCWACVRFELAEVLVPVGEVARLEKDFVLATLRQLFRLQLSELVTVVGLVPKCRSVLQLVKSAQELARFASNRWLLTLSRCGGGLHSGRLCLRHDFQVYEAVALYELEVAIGKDQTCEFSHILGVHFKGKWVLFHKLDNRIEEKMKDRSHPVFDLQLGHLGGKQVAKAVHIAGARLTCLC